MANTSINADEPLLMDPGNQLYKPSVQGHDSESSEAEDEKISVATANAGFLTRSTRAVKRTIPFFVDVIIIGMYLGVFGVFLYYAYFYKNTSANGEDCIANAQSTAALPTTSQSIGVNVTKKFHTAITFGFWIATINIARACMAQVAIYFNNVTV